MAPAADGSTAVVADGAAPAVSELPALPGTALVDLWRSDVVPLVVAPSDELADPTDAPFELMPPGSLFRIIDLGPDGAGEPLWHQTDTVDFIYVASGRATFLHDGGSVDLVSGDTIVVQGVRHAWTNPGSEVCRLVDVSVATA